MLTLKHKNVLYRTIDIIQASEITWALTGSTSFSIQGMDVDVHDIDIQTDKKGAYKIGRALSRFVVRPVSFSSTQTIRSHFGCFAMDGIDIEVMGDIQKQVDGHWEDIVRLPPLIKYVSFENVRIPVLDLRYEYEAYRKMGRFDKADRIKNFLSASSFNS